MKVSITEAWRDDNDLQIFASLYKMMNEHAEEILASVKAQITDPAILRNIDQVEMELHNFDLDGATSHQYVCLSYNTESHFITIFIEDNGKEVLIQTNPN